MKRIVILGAGESGAGAAVLAKVKGFETFVSDMSAIKDKYKDARFRKGHIVTEEDTLGRSVPKKNRKNLRPNQKNR